LKNRGRYKTGKMVRELIMGVSGVRGIVGENLTSDIAALYGRAFGTFLKQWGPIFQKDREMGTQSIGGQDRLSVCIGRDSRTSGRMLSSAVAAGLCAVGIDVIDLGLVTTPGVSIMTAQLSCAGGIVITASHNPIEYNGIKVFLADGSSPRPDLAQKIKQIYLDKKFNLVDSDSVGKITTNEQTDAVHIEKVLAIVDKRAIAAKRFKILLDSVNGTGGRVTRKLLTELGCEAIMINDEPTGLFAHTPEPLAENLTGLCEAVAGNGADIGFAQDPDADRLAIVDENGNYLGEEYSFALAAKYIFSKTTGTAATNLSTSRMIDDIASAAGSSVIRTAVGEANVVDAMIKNSCIIGGEGNGGVIDLRVAPIRDSLLGIVLILQLMTETGLSISKLAAEIPKYYMKKQKLHIDKSQSRQIFEQAKKIFQAARVDTTDGCRFDFDDGWLHLRTSNTEPIMRAIAEAEDEETACKYIDMVLSIRNEIIG